MIADRTTWFCAQWEFGKRNVAMSYRVACPGCGAAYTLGENLYGKKIRCSRCQEVFLGVCSTPQPQELPYDESDAHGSAASSEQLRPRLAPISLPQAQAGAAEFPPTEGNQLGVPSVRRRRSQATLIVAGLVGAFLLFGCVSLVGGVAVWRLWLQKESSALADAQLPANGGQPNAEDRSKDHQPQPPDGKRRPAPVPVGSDIKPAPLKAQSEDRVLSSSVTDACVVAVGGFSSCTCRGSESWPSST
jgi:hypothetical protein